MSTHRVVFTPSGRRGTVEGGTTILDAARSLGVDLDSVCGGRGICGRCQVSLGSSPAIPSDPDAFSPPGPTELNYRGRRPLTADRRLGCAVTIRGDVVVDVPPDSHVHRQVVRKRPELADYPIDPVIRLHYVETQAPTLADARSDVDRIADALLEEWGLDDLTFDPEVISGVHAALVAGAWSATVAVHDRSNVIAAWPGFHDRLYGVAFDVGSTTIAGHLLDLTTGQVLASTGAMNPQIRYGEDLMSRVSHVMMHPEGAAAMTVAVRGALDQLVEDLAGEAGVARTEILDVALVGNPIMHHLVLGYDPTPLGSAPFAPVVSDALDLSARHIDLAINPGARLFVLPLVAGHVGADTMGAVLSEGPHRRHALQLLVDVGTNAEIVLGNDSRLLAASSPTGPAFEGAQISAGQRATPGAIERVRIDAATGQPRLRVIGSDIWSDEPGFDGAVEATGVTGICGSGIIEAVAELFLAGIVASDGTIQPGRERVEADGRTFAYRLWDDPVIRVTQNDVRAIQLAKAALYAGTRLLMDRAGIEAVDEIRLAGAFGSHIDPKYAMVLGLIPDCDLTRVSAAGNAAGSGAIMALLSKSARLEIIDVADGVEKVETAVEPSFQEHFVAAMGLPHTNHQFPHLAAAVRLPEPKPGGRRHDRRRGGRRREEKT
ncbi:MAG TPA: ASKHA domain-containing protein [Acidimicrobiia bacterium]|nr:ASKHA domain-containing protein [Acidimicrobiia bacterium]